MDSSSFIRVDKIFNSKIVVAGDTLYSSVIDLSMCSGSIAMQLKITGDGTLKIDVLYSNDGISFYIPETNTSVVTGLTKTSGGGSDGGVMFTFSADVAAFMKFRITETGGANSVTVTGIVAIN